MLHQPRPKESVPTSILREETQPLEGSKPDKQQKMPSKRPIPEDCAATFWSWALPGGFRDER